MKAHAIKKREEYIYYICSSARCLLRKKGFKLESYNEGWRLAVNLCSDCAPVSKEEAKEKFPELF